MLPGMYNPLSVGLEPIELVSSELDEDWGRTGDNPSDYTIGIDPAAGEILVSFVGGREGNRAFSFGQHTNLLLDGSGQIVGSTAAHDRGFDDDTVGGSAAWISGAQADVVATSRAVDPTQPIDGYGIASVILKNTLTTGSPFRDVDAYAADNQNPFSRTVDVEPGDYVIGYVFLRRTGTNITWTGLTEIAEASGSGFTQGIAGALVTTSGTLAVTAGTGNGDQGYMCVLVVRPG